MAKWECGLCGYIYDDEKEGTPFEELSYDWACPDPYDCDCGATKDAFKKIKD